MESELTCGREISFHPQVSFLEILEKCVDKNAAVCYYIKALKKYIPQ